MRIHQILSISSYWFCTHFVRVNHFVQSGELLTYKYLLTAVIAEVALLCLVCSQHWYTSAVLGAGLLTASPVHYSSVSRQHVITVSKSVCFSSSAAAGGELRVCHVTVFVSTLVAAAAEMWIYVFCHCLAGAIRQSVSCQ